MKLFIHTHSKDMLHLYTVGGAFACYKLNLVHFSLACSVYICSCFSFLVFLTYLNRSTFMEASHPLSIESFSYSWLVNLKPSVDLSLDNSFRSSLDASDEASFIEMDPTMTASKRFFRNSQDFKFDFPISQSPLAVVHADELFSDGYLMPLFMDTGKMEAYYEASDHSTSALPSAYSHAPKLLVPAAENNPYCSSLRRSCRRMSKHIFQKYLDFLRPLLRRLGGNKSRSSKAEVVDKRLKNWAYSSRTSPRISVAYPSDHRRRSCDSESSIYEAVLHCKRSIGK
ncbi:probable membrane-associated kinase regulator 6 [Carya illinoinensis]|nr:probable membrane-associated kinase regulator 6 [Carya illinoinensis]